MALIPRLLIGLRGSQNGMWLSQKGKNVLTCNDPDEMLLSPNQTNIQVVAKGNILGMSYGDVRNVYFPATYTVKPLVMFEVLYSTSTFRYPYMADINPAVPNGWVGTVFTDHVSFTAGRYGVGLAYLVLAAITY